MVKVCLILPSSANVYKDCQNLANVGKMMQDVTYCVHNNFSHDVQHMSAMIYFSRLFKIVACRIGSRNLRETLEFGAVQKCVDLADLLI